MSNGTITQIGPKNGKHWLHDDTLICRYIPLKNLFAYLDGCIFLPSVKKLQASDPFEGEFPIASCWFDAAFDARVAKKHKGVIKYIHRQLYKSTQEGIKAQQWMGGRKRRKRVSPEYGQWYLDFVVKTRFAWCWFAADMESAAMWSTYGLNGAVVTSTVGDVRKLLAKCGHRGGYRRMEYYDYSGINFLTPCHKELVLRPFFFKSGAYASENEVRFVVVDPSKRYRDAHGLLLEDVSPMDWIHRVVLGPGLTKQQVNALRKGVHSLCKKVLCGASELHYSKKQEMDERHVEVEKKVRFAYVDPLPSFLEEI